MRNILAAAVATLILGGCYELDQPIFKEGQRASITGSYVCTGFMNARRDKIRETTTGLIWKDYRYVNAANETITLKKLQGTLYIAQIESDGIFAAFLDVQSPERFLIRVPDLLSHAHTIDQLANRLHIRTRTSSRNRELITLQGTDPDITAFLTQHGPQLLTTVMDCNLTPS